jgi:hypothetical protein
MAIHQISSKIPALSLLHSHLDNVAPPKPAFQRPVSPTPLVETLQAIHFAEFNSWIQSIQSPKVVEIQLLVHLLTKLHNFLMGKPRIAGTLK